MFEAVRLLKILALCALATCHFAKSRIPKDKKVMFLRTTKQDSLVVFFFFFNNYINC